MDVVNLIKFGFCPDVLSDFSNVIKKGPDRQKILKSFGRLC